MNSRDIIISLALEYDLPTLLNYCRTSKRINDLVCNNNLFWVLKLKKDFDISPEDISLKEKKDKMYAKKYYEYILDEIRQFSDINEAYSHAIHIGILNLVRATLHKGANINHLNNNRTPLITATVFGNHHIVNYLLERGITDEKDFIYNITKITEFMTETPITSQQREALTWLMYDKIFPRMYHFGSRYKNFWKTAAERLEEYKRYLPILYERRINELKALI